MIVHLSVLPGFGIAVEARQRPELTTLPAVMGGATQQRGLVDEANLPAQQRGIHAGMTLAQARQHCPDCLVLLPDLPRYTAVWEDICAILRRYTPLVEPLELGQAVCDLSGDARRWRNDGRHAALSIMAAVQEASGITPSLGVGANRLVAQLAAALPPITVIPPGGERIFLADLPLALFPGVDARLLLTLQVLGLRTASQFAALPRAAVRQRFGPSGEGLHDGVRGIDPRPVTPPPARPAITARCECEEGTPEEALALLHELAERCAADLTQTHQAGRVIELILEWEPCAPDDPAAALLPAPTSVLPASPASPLPSPSPCTASSGAPQPPNVELPIPYRIHSMLPQPGATRRPSPTSPRPPSDQIPVPYPETALLRNKAICAGSSCTGSSGLPTRVTAAVRTPIATAAPLLARAEYLLRQHWPRNRQVRLVALELTVSSFASPTQLAFGQLNLLSQGGSLAGIDAPRLQALLQTEDVLAARYGDTSFRTLAHVDPDSILTERRFRWRSGLPWGPTTGSSCTGSSRSGRSTKRQHRIIRT